MLKINNQIRLTINIIKLLAWLSFEKEEHFTLNLIFLENDPARKDEKILEMEIHC